MKQRQCAFTIPWKNPSHAEVPTGHVCTNSIIVNPIGTYWKSSHSTCHTLPLIIKCVHWLHCSSLHQFVLLHFLMHVNKEPPVVPATWWECITCAECRSNSSTPYSRTFHRAPLNGQFVSSKHGGGWRRFPTIHIPFLLQGGLSQAQSYPMAHSRSATPHSGPTQPGEGFLTLLESTSQSGTFSAQLLY
jgi:hypothetical protein